MKGTTTKKINDAVDYAWFKAEIEKRGVTNRWLADKLEMSYADFSRCIKGDANFELQEVVGLSRLFSVPLTEILRRVGVETPAAVHVSSVQVPVTGRVDAEGQVIASEGGNVSSGVGAAVEALRVTAVPGLDSAVLFLDRPREASSCVGRLCVVEVEGASGLYYVRRGSDEGLFSLISAANTAKVRDDVKVSTVKPAVWAKL